MTRPDRAREMALLGAGELDPALSVACAYAWQEWRSRWGDVAELDPSGEWEEVIYRGFVAGFVAAWYSGPGGKFSDQIEWRRASDAARKAP